MSVDKYTTINNKTLSTSKRVVILTSALIFFLLIWQTISASKIHQRYQTSLMDTVTAQILTEYQEYFAQLRLEIDLFQQKQLTEINALQKSGKNASVEKYMEVLTSLRSDIKNTRLFALIDEKGSLQHITGDFLPSCEEEITSTIASGKQEHLFLHRSEKSVHFDLLQPLSTNNGQGDYFFVAFNPDVLTNLLNKYQLPHQQLFLMRADRSGEIELTTEDLTIDYASMFISDDELSDFSFIKAIPNTRWQLAIRLEPRYSTTLYKQGLLKALAIWLVLTLIIYGFYRLQRIRTRSHLHLKQELAFKDNHDPLTGLVNRLRFESLLNAQLLQHQENETMVNGVVLHIDVDKFQVINNSFGYAIGDSYLYKASTSLKTLLPADAIISRLGSDEFALLLPSLPHTQAKEFAHKVRLLFQDISISAHDEKVSLTASIGAVILDDSQYDTEQVFSSLGQAVSLAKEKGRNRVQVYQSNDKQLIQHAKEMAAIHEVSQALQDNRLALYRQQIKPINGSHSSHFEVLVRMLSSEGELIAPNDFIPAAEKYGLIRHVDHWVIENTFKKMLANESDKTTCYCINLSGSTLADRDIYDQVIALFKRYKISPQRICFEITETAAITHLKSALHFMDNMIAFGCSFSLDDFGTGLSSFGYLQKLPVSTIKIDGSFVRDMDTNEVNYIFVENIKRIATAMNKKTVAEFIESEKIETLLTEIGIDFGQGYHIHKPEPWLPKSD